jgi:hypothetical protein
MQDGKPIQPYVPPKSSTQASIKKLPTDDTYYFTCLLLGIAIKTRYSPPLFATEPDFRLARDAAGKIIRDPILAFSDTVCAVTYLQKRALSGHLTLENLKNFLRAITEDVTQYYTDKGKLADVKKRLADAGIKDDKLIFALPESRFKNGYDFKYREEIKYFHLYIPDIHINADEEHKIRMDRTKERKGSTPIPPSYLMYRLPAEEDEEPDVHVISKLVESSPSGKIVVPSPHIELFPGIRAQPINLKEGITILIYKYPNSKEALNDHVAGLLNNANPKFAGDIRGTVWTLGKKGLGNFVSLSEDIIARIEEEQDVDGSALLLRQKLEDKKKVNPQMQQVLDDLMVTD